MTASGSGLSRTAAGRTDVRASGGHHITGMVLGLLVVASASLDWLRVFPSGPLLSTIGVAVVVPTALVTLWTGGRVRLSLWAAPALNAACWLVLVSVTLMHARGPGQLLAGAGQAVTAARDSWYDLLALVPPAPADPALLVGVHAVVWLAAYVTAEILARTRATLPALLPGFLVLVLGLVFGYGGRRVSWLSAGVFLLCALALILLRHGGTAGHRALGAGLPLITAIAALALVLGPPSLAGRDRHPFDPRQLVHPAVLARSVVNPLDQVPAWLSTPDMPLFRVQAPAPQNWRIAVLDQFDGQTWRTDDTFLATGARIPGPDGPPSTRAVTQVVTISGLSGAWLPAAAAPVAIAGVGALADPTTGVLLGRAPLTPGQRYQVTSQVPQYDAESLRQAVPDRGAQRDIDLPSGLPDVIRTAADAATAGASSPFQQASQLEHYLRSSARNDLAAQPGHAYGHLAYFLGVSHRGTSEQFATAFAVMARSLGLPTRIVVGFRPGTVVSPGVWQVTGGDALVWPEVDFAGLGWVPFFPTPNATTGPAGPSEGQSAERQQLDQMLAAPQPAPVARPAVATGVRPTPSHGPDWLVAATSIGVVPVAYLVAVLMVPAIRTYRRRRLTDPERAWRPRGGTPFACSGG